MELEPRESLATLHEIRIAPGDSAEDLTQRVALLASAQFVHLRDLIEPGRTITVEVGVIT